MDISRGLAEGEGEGEGAPRAGPLTFDAFRRANVQRCLRWHPDGIESWSPSDWLTAITGELGELAGLIKMRNRERDGLPGNKFSPTRKQIADELADVVTYADLLAEAMGVNLGRAVAEKFNEVSARVGFPDRIDLPPEVRPVPPHGVVSAPEYRGYANLGAGGYWVSTSAADTGAAELVVYMATELERATFTPGDQAMGPRAIEPDTIAVRLCFASAEVLSMFEARLRDLRGDHFPQSLQPVTSASLPSWQDSRAATDMGGATPLHAFIYEYEPSSMNLSAHRKFRADLAALVGHVKGGGAC